MFGSYEPQLPSRFFKDIPDDLVKMESTSRSYYQRGYDRWESGSYRRGSGRFQRGREDSFFDDWDEKASSSHTWDSVNSRREQRSQSSGHAAILPKQSDAPQRNKKTEATYRAGMKVKHPTFGEGMILNVRLEGDGEETLDIFFSELKQQKKLAASFVKLDIIE